MILQMTQAFTVTARRLPDQLQHGGTTITLWPMRQQATTLFSKLINISQLSDMPTSRGWLGRRRLAASCQSRPPALPADGACAAGAWA